MGTLNPGNIAGLAAALLLFGTIVGNPIRKWLLDPMIFEGRTASLAIRWVTSLMTGLAVVPLVFLNVGLVPGLAAWPLAWILLLVMLAWNVYLYRDELLRLRGRLPRLWSRLGVHDRAFAAAFLTILVFELSPLWGLWTTPGDDAKLYSLITLRFIDTAGIPSTWGSFAPATWYIEKTHLLLPGFSSLAAGMVYLTGVDVPTGVSVVTSVFRVLPAATLYVLMFTLTGRKTPALLTTGIYGFLIVEPINGWFQWGGMAELSAISLLPLAVAGTYLAYVQAPLNRRFFAWLAVVMGGMSLVHPFAMFYFLAFLVPLTLVVLLKRQVRRGLRMWLPVAGGLVLAGAPIVNALGSETSIAASYSVYNPAWTPVAAWSMDLPSVLFSVAWRMVTVYGAAVVLLLVLGVVVLKFTWKWNRTVLTVLGLWFAGMFFLHENNPNGLWLVPFPLWYRIDANRTFGVTSFIAASVTALVLEETVAWIVPFRADLVRMKRLARLRLIWKDHRRTIIAIALVALALGQAYSNAALNSSARNLAPITADDMAAFQWIQTQTPSSAMFFVNWADAGTWIPLYAQRTVVLPFGVVTNYALLNAFYQYDAEFAANPACLACLTFMKNLGATYVYAGPARIYGRPGFDPLRVAATGYFDTVYHGGTVWIFQMKTTGRLSPLAQPANASHSDGNPTRAGLGGAVATSISTTADLSAVSGAPMPPAGYLTGAGPGEFAARVAPWHAAARVLEPRRPARAAEG